MSRSPRSSKTKKRRGAGQSTKRARAGSDSKIKKSRPLNITPGVLRRRLPLPQPDAEGDKEERGLVLVVGGSPEMPGAVILCATAALRAGAGKLQIATCRSVAHVVGAAVPEARVFALPETKDGGIATRAVDELAERAKQVQAIVIGAGMLDDAAVARLLKKLLPRIERTTVVVLDAAALSCLAADSELLHALRGNVIITPHAGEMSTITGIEKSDITRDSLEIARRAAAELRAVVALKGRETFIVAPGGESYCNRAGNVGLATSGSGDTLSGIIAGLAARGATPLSAAAWGVHLHARAGDRLARRTGRLGFLARELLAEIPALMSELDKPKQR